MGRASRAGAPNSWKRLSIRAFRCHRHRGCRHLKRLPPFSRHAACSHQPDL